jgi:hypothetical protein
VGLAALVRLRALRALLALLALALAGLFLALAAAGDGVEAGDASVDELHDALFISHGILSIWFLVLFGTVGNHSKLKNLLQLLSENKIVFAYQCKSLLWFFW